MPEGPKVQFPMDVTESLHWHNSSVCTMVLGLTVPLREMDKEKVSKNITGLDKHLSF
jgi:hypothetical protein